MMKNPILVSIFSFIAFNPASAHVCSDDLKQIAIPAVQLSTGDEASNLGLIDDSAQTVAPLMKGKIKLYEVLEFNVARGKMGAWRVRGLYLPHATTPSQCIRMGVETLDISPSN